MKKLKSSNSNSSLQLTTLGI